MCDLNSNWPKQKMIDISKCEESFLLHDCFEPIQQKGGFDKSEQYCKLSAGRKIMPVVERWPCRGMTEVML